MSTKFKEIKTEDIPAIMAELLHLTNKKPTRYTLSFKTAAGNTSTSAFIRKPDAATAVQNCS
jgi:hypothetical protein